MSSIDSAEPIREKLRNAKDDPRQVKSNTDSEAPKREMPHTDKADPMRA
jgi:hypothetical protein